MPAPTIRTFHEGDVEGLARLLDRCFGTFETWTEERVAEIAAASGSDTAPMWVALDSSHQIGCVRVHGAPRAGTYVIRELAVDAKHPDELAGRLLATALDHVSALDAIHIRASTPTVAPYPAVYERSGFTPVRRALTLVWDLTELPEMPGADRQVVVGDALRHPPELLAELHVEGMRPYWDWYIEERGGVEPTKERVAAHVARLPPGGGSELWLAAQAEGEVVGLSYVQGVGEEEADFGGVYVLPSYRNKGVGSSLMRATLKGLGARTARLVVPETMCFLDSETPSIRLYKRSGARIRAEYLHLDGAGVQPGG